MTCIPVPGFGAANFEKGTNLSAWLDNSILNGHLWSATKTWDPEGILSTIPAIATGIIGMLIGQLLNIETTKIEIIKKLTLLGISLIALGLIWSLVFPINKSLWSSSYVLYTAGLAISILMILYYLIEIANYKKWTKLFLIWGVNPMIVFFLSVIISKVLHFVEFKNPEMSDKTINLQEYFYSTCIKPFFNNPKPESMAFALVNVAMWSFILWIFYRKKMIFKV